MQNKIQKIIRAKKFSNKEQGVALLFTVLLTSMLLLVALGIANIAYKEALFSNEARDSDRAFFAADTGVECALFLDKQLVFSVPTLTPMPPSDLCNAMSFAVDSGVTNLSTSPSIYKFMIPIATNGTCVDVTVDKAFPDPLLAPGVTYTQITSAGYNVPASGTTCTAGMTTASTRIVSRVLQTQYKN